jgi:hypothetical protein
VDGVVVEVVVAVVTVHPDHLSVENVEEEEEEEEEKGVVVVVVVVVCRSSPTQTVNPQL